MKPSHSRLPYLAFGLLAAWLVAGAAGIGFTDTAPDTPFLAYALLLFVAILAVVNLFRFSALLSVVTGCAVYNVVMLTLRPFDTQLILPLAVGNGALVGAGLLGWNAARQVARLQKQIAHCQNVIQDLRVKDPDLGVARLPFAMQTLRTEVLRSQRYNSSLCLMLLNISDQEEIQKEQGTAAVLEIKRQVSGVLDGMLREMDCLFSDKDKVFGIILPETSLDGAMAVSRRIIDNVARKVRVGLHVGVAEFGVDAFTDVELYQAAETALQLAEKTDKAVVQYAQVRNATGDLDESTERAVSMN